MKYEIIKTENYLLVVDESEIKFDDWYIDDSNLLRPSVTSDKDYWSTRKDYKKVIAHLPLNGSPILEGVDLLPPLEDEDSEAESSSLAYISEEIHNLDRINGFIDGYDEAKEKYNADIHGILSDFYVFATNGEVCNHKIIDEFIQSLSQPKMPIGFECETEYKIALDGHTIIGTEPKTTTTPEGHTQWVGTYIYE